MTVMMATRLASELGWPTAQPAPPAGRSGLRQVTGLGWPVRSPHLTAPVRTGQNSQGVVRVGEDVGDVLNYQTGAGQDGRRGAVGSSVGSGAAVASGGAEERAAAMNQDGWGGSEQDPSTLRIRQMLSDVVSRETPHSQVEALGPEPPLDVSRETFADTPIAAEALRAVRVLNPSGEEFPHPPHRRVVTIANQKGGVGKTTTAVNLAVGLALHGSRVLVIDLDPQGNASTGLGVDHHSGVPSIYEVLLGERGLAETTVQVEATANLWCVPATIDLAGAEIELVSVVARESRLRRAVEAFDRDVDYVFIDCPPSLGLLTVNALVAADEVLIPIQCEYYALEGLGQLLRNIELVQAHLNNQVRISTILLTMYDGRTKLADQVAHEVRAHFGDLVLEAVVPRSVRVSEAPGYGQSVLTYDPGSRGALTYLDAAREIAERGAYRATRTDVAAASNVWTEPPSDSQAAYHTRPVTGSDHPEAGTGWTVEGGV
jgi:chromosome partitioning protein